MLASARYPLGSPEIERLRACSEENINWQVFSALAIRHRIVPTVHQNLTSNLPAVVPGPVLAAFKERAERNRQRILVLLAELARLSSRFAGERIRLCALKGPLLAQRLFNDAGLRTSRDLDLLVHDEDLGRAEAILHSHGYRRTYPARPLTPRQWRVYKREGYHFTCDHPERHITLELHWAIDSPRLIAQEFSRQIFERAVPAAQANAGLLELTAEDLPVYLALHGARHNWVRLKWLVDFDAWMRLDQGRDWLVLYARMDDLGLARALAQALVLAQTLFHTPIPKPLIPLLEAEPLTGKLLRHSFTAILDENFTGGEVGQFERLVHLRYLMDLKPGWRHKWNTLNRIWIAPEDWADLPLPDLLFPLYWPLRPCLWLWRNHLRPGRDRSAASATDPE